MAEIGHKAEDNGKGLCSICGRKVANYPKLGGMQHARGGGGLHKQSMTPTAKQVKAAARADAEQAAIKEVAAGKEHVRQADAAAENAAVSLKEHIRQILVSRGTMRDVQTLSSWLAHDGTRTSAIEITKALWSLQKMGEVAFEERKHGGDSVLTKIAVTRGVRTATFKTGESKGPHPVGIDKTDPKAHAAVAEGGPIERENTPEKIVQEVVPAVEYVAPPKIVKEPERYRAPEPARQNEIQPAGTPVDPLLGYPILNRLMADISGRSKYETAAKALEGVDDDLALEILAKIRKLTPFEEEVIRYVQSHR